MVLGSSGWSKEARATQALEEFLAQAKTKNFELREQRAQIIQNQANADVALGRLLPGFTARGVYSRNQFDVVTQLPGGAGRLVIQPQDQLDAFFQLDVPLVDVGSYCRYRTSKVSVEASQEQEGATELQISAGVARSYFAFVASSALARAALESVRLAEANLRSVDDRASSGAATELDRQRALANVERAKQDVADAELMRGTSARALEQASGLAPTESTSFSVDDLSPELPMETWLSFVPKTPGVRASQKGTEAAEMGVTAAKMTLLPILSGAAQQRFTNATGFANRDSIYQLQLVLTWHADYGMWAQYKALEAGAEVAKVRDEKVRRTIADAILVKCRAASAQSTAAARAAELANDRYGAGASTQLEVTQAQRDAFLAEAARIGADAELAMSRTALRLLAGQTPVAQRTP
jgi:outer membrane protein